MIKPGFTYGFNDWVDGTWENFYWENETWSNYSWEVSYYVNKNSEISFDASDANDDNTLTDVGIVYTWDFDPQFTVVSGGVNQSEITILTPDVANLESFSNNTLTISDGYESSIYNIIVNVIIVSIQFFFKQGSEN